MSAFCIFIKTFSFHQIIVFKEIADLKQMNERFHVRVGLNDVGTDACLSH